MITTFDIELKSWMNNTLSPYCLELCQHSCCNCSINEEIKIDPGYEHLFKTFKITGEKVPFKPKSLISEIPHLYNDSLGHLHFTSGFCPNYNPQIKKCMIHDQHPMCILFPLVRTAEKYKIVPTCELHKMKINQEPLKSLLELCKKHKLKLIK